MFGLTKLFIGRMSSWKLVFKEWGLINTTKQDKILVNQNSKLLKPDLNQTLSFKSCLS